ncbi:hypothetical protein C8Q79DRAFT_628825 [Trametes meyenii]|nr:hypothetical protein C8Q79DRAFT_628825 [Trametes meyenii]
MLPLGTGCVRCTPVPSRTTRLFSFGTQTRVACSKRPLKALSFVDGSASVPNSSPTRRNTRFNVVTENQLRIRPPRSRALSRRCVRAVHPPRCPALAQHPPHCQGVSEPRTRSRARRNLPKRPERHADAPEPNRIVMHMCTVTIGTEQGPLIRGGGPLSQLGRGGSESTKHPAVDSAFCVPLLRHAKFVWASQPERPVESTSMRRGRGHRRAQAGAHKHLLLLQLLAQRSPRPLAPWPTGGPGKRRGERRSVVRGVQ